MARAQAAVARDLCQALVESYAVNDRMNQLVLEHLDPGAWRAKLPGSKGRTIAAIFSHVHNIRRKWLRLSAPHLKLPAPLDRGRCSLKQAGAALAESAACCCECSRTLWPGPRAASKPFAEMDGRNCGQRAQPWWHT